MKQKGFSFIELMIVVVIIGILASIAIPSYKQYVIRASRMEGMASLMDIMRAQENLFANEFTYTTNLSNVNYSFSSKDKYKITASKCGTAPLTECIQLTATGQKEQVIDGALTLNSRGERFHNNKSGWPKN